MNNPLKVYNVELTVKGPVFIGSGQELKKKEYINLKPEHKVLIPKLDKMYMDLCRMGKQKEYEKYMLENNQNSLGEWIQKQGIPQTYLKEWKDYELDAGDAIADKRKMFQVMTCVKDAYGNPYIPGSSFKGMLRTILLAYDIKKNPEKYEEIKAKIRKKIKSDSKENRKEFLNWEEKNLEVKAFHTLKREKSKTKEMVNDYMAGVIVGDSMPLSVSDLTLCQKLEYHVDGRETRLNLLRECIKPGTKVQLQLTIDKNLHNLSERDIMDAIEDFSNTYYEVFVKKFQNTDRPSADTVWLGGGAGYVSKTVIYSLFGEEGVCLVPKVFQKTKVPYNHKHNQDQRLGVSPHILKMTQYQGKKLPFGECSIAIQAMN